MKSSYSPGSNHRGLCLPITRVQQKVETRRRILEEAAAAFSEHGYEGTTTRQIAQACGVSIGSVFAHFPNKQSLLQAVLYDGIELALGRARRKLKVEAGVEEAMAVFATSLYTFYHGRQDLSRELLKHSLFDSREFAGQLRLFHQELMSRMREHTLASRDKEVLADTLLSHYFFVLLALLNEPGISVQQAVKRLRRMNAQVFV